MNQYLTNYLCIKGKRHISSGTYIFIKEMILKRFHI